MSEHLSPAVVFAFLNTESQVLMQSIPATDEYPEAEIIPGGKREPSDETVEDALLREIREELGRDVKILSYNALPLKEAIFSPLGRTLFPFIISQWEGDIPNTVLDKGHPLHWVDISQVINSPIDSVRKLAIALQEHLTKP